MRLEGSLPGRNNAKRLRKQMTPPEIALWLALRANEEGLRFRKQHAAGPHVLDVYCTPAAAPKG
jgi:very-short-patch-repair endonuclease